MDLLQYQTVKYVRLVRMHRRLDLHIALFVLQAIIARAKSRQILALQVRSPLRVSESALLARAVLTAPLFRLLHCYVKMDIIPWRCRQSVQSATLECTVHTLLRVQVPFRAQLVFFPASENRLATFAPQENTRS